MLGKLTKYEFKSMGRILLPLFAAVIIMSIISPLSLKLTASVGQSDFNVVRFIAYLTLVLYIMLIAAMFAMSVIVSVLRFKKSLLDNEGYLMNVLPVNAWQNISSKLFTAAVYQVLSVVVALISIIIAFSVSYGFAALELDDVFRGFAQVTAYLGA